MNIKFISTLAFNNFLFWLSRRIDYPLLPPDMVQVNFTFHCNLSCKMCSMHNQMKLLQSQGKRTEIESDVFRKIIRQTKDMGTKNILFIGGEPLLRKDLFELVSYAKQQGLNTVIVTNGTLLNEQAVHRCFASGVDWLSISIDAAQEQTFDAIRGQGIFEKLMRNIRTLQELKAREKQHAPNIVSVCTIMDDNLQELMQIVKLCQKLRIARIILQPVVFNNADQSDRSDTCRDAVPAERFPVLDRAMDDLIAFKKQSRQNFTYIANSIRQLQMIRKYLKGQLNNYRLPCYAGYNRLQITQDSVVYFCIPPVAGVPNSFGDVTQDNLKDLWYSPEARLRRKLIRTCRTPCMQWCSYRDEFIALSDLIHQAVLFGLNGGKSNEPDGKTAHKTNTTIAPQEHVDSRRRYPVSGRS